MRHMKATLIIRERVVFADGALIDIKVWRVPEPGPPTTHGLKYSLFYDRPGQRLVACDNDAAKAITAIWAARKRLTYSHPSSNC